MEALEKLTIFTEAGGTLVLVGDTPEHGLRLEQEDAIAALMEKLSDQPHLDRLNSTNLIEALEGIAHRDLTVRITGYSAVFVDMVKRAQDDIIRREEMAE